jgi:hypothetical protein
MKIVAITPDQKLDYLVSNVIDGLKELNHQIIASDAGNGVEKVYSNEEVIKHSIDADYIFVFFGKVKNNNPPKRYLLDKMGEIYNKLVYIEDSEWTCTAHPLPGQVEISLSDPKKRRGDPWLDEDMLKRCRWYFKHSCYPEDVDRGIIPFQICASKNMIAPTANKDIDLLCSFGQTSNGLRAQALEICKRIKKETNYNIITEAGMSKEKYLDVLSHSRIVIDGWGGSENNPRTWEAMCNGACVLYQRYTTVMMHPLSDYVDSVSYATEIEFEERLMKLLANKEETLVIGNTARQTSLEHHIPVARVKYLLNKIQSNY